jgi:hypothetical protein
VRGELAGGLVVAVSLRGRDEIKLARIRAATMSALNLWNRNTERVADALSRDSGIEAMLHEMPSSIEQGQRNRSHAPRNAAFHNALALVGTENPGRVS